MPRVANPRARLYKKRGFYYCDLRFKNTRKRISCLTDKLGEAERTAEQELARFRVEVGLEAEGRTREGPRYSIGEALDAFTDEARDAVSGNAPGTRRMFRSKAKGIKDRIGYVECCDLSAAHIADYLAWRRAEHQVKEHTLSKELTTLRRALGFAQEQGLVDGSWRAAVPADFKPAYAPRDRWLELHEYRALLDAVEPCRRFWVTVACYTGGRVSELEALEWRDIDLRRGFVRIQTAKRRHGAAPKPRFIPIAPELRKTLLRERGDGRVGLLFPTPWENPALMLTRCARSAGICGPVDTINDNDLRRTFASWLLQRGATIKETADLLGHSSTAMVERVYGHLAKRNLVAAVKRLPRFR